MKILEIFRQFIYYILYQYLTNDTTLAQQITVHRLLIKKNQICIEIAFVQGDMYIDNS